MTRLPIKREKETLMKYMLEYVLAAISCALFCTRWPSSLERRKRSDNCWIDLHLGSLELTCAAAMRRVSNPVIVELA